MPRANYNFPRIHPVPFDVTEAACNGADPKLFYPPAFDWVPANAKLICDGCPFKDECLEYAIAHEEYGIWAGTSGEDRRRIRRQRGARLRTAI
jgi:WhiB family transcriptional regulator, redox-sensing transcriptional regulator